MRTDLKKFAGPNQHRFEALAKEWEDKHVKIIGDDHPWCGEVGHVQRIDMMGAVGKPAMIVKLDNGTECAVFSGRELKQI